MSLRPRERLHQYRGHVLVTKPLSEPVTLSEVKTALAIDGNADDSFIADLIDEAREEIEEITGLALITQEWRLSLDHWPSGRGEWWDGTRQMAISELFARGPKSWVVLPRYPLQSIDQVRVFGIDGTPEVVNVADVFDVDVYQRPGRMALKFGQTWPIALRDTNAIEIEYTAGFGTSGDVPTPIRRAIRQMACYMYEHRGDGCSPSEALHASGAAVAAKRYQVARI